MLRQLPSPRLVYDLGCGSCDDVSTYRAVWGDIPILGLDYDRASLRYARTLDPTLLLLEAGLNALPLLPRADLILIRHPDVHRFPDTWRQVCSTLPTWLAPSCLLFVTTYTAPEFDLIRRWIGDSLTIVPINIAALGAVGLDGRDRYNGCFKSLGS
jgi:trans-aconitate methyltransferase